MEDEKDRNKWTRGPDSVGGREQRDKKRRSRRRLDSKEGGEGQEA